MTDNTERIERLERKMDNIEQTLELIKNRLCGAVEVDANKDKPKTTDEKWNLLSDVERNKIDNIIENFDFKKVQSVMDYLDWRWFGTKNGVPSMDEIKEMAHELLVDSAFEKSTLSTGGFKATYEPDKENPDDPFILLEFILTDCEGFDEDVD